MPSFTGLPFSIPAQKLRCAQTRSAVIFVLDTNAVSETSKPRPNPGLIDWLSAQDPAHLFITTVSPAIEFGDVKTSDGYHNLSHHGKSKEKLAQLKNIDEWHMKLLAELFTDLKNIREEGEPLLDRTMILYGSNLGNANTHVTTNMPTLFAGGGFRHGQHIAFDTQHNYPLPNLFLSMLQRMGLETDRFASANGTMRGLKMA